MMTLDFEYFFRQLKAGMNVNEICFYFTDDPEEEHYLGYHPEQKNPYWVGYCDIKDGTAFKTAKELVNAPIFDGKSLKSRWENVHICSIEAIPLKEWMEYMEHVD